MEKIYFFFILLIFANPIFMGAQNSLSVEKDLIQCEKHLAKRNYKKAKECYLEALTFKPNNTKILVRLTEICYRLGERDEAKEYIDRAVDMNVMEAYDPLMYLAQQMSFQKENQMAVYILDRLGNNVQDPAQKSKVNSLKGSYLLQKYELNNPRYNVVLDNLGDSINSPESEYLPALSLDGETLVFTRRVGGANEDFFIAKKDSNGNWRKAINMGYPPNTSMPDGACKLSADGNYLFFTRCDMRSQNGIESGGCDLAFCYKELVDGNEVWSSPQYFKYTINTTAYEGQPCLSSDNNDLYFVSEREEGYGGKDIYVSHLERGFWSKPKNLGPNINSKGNETAPFIHPDNETLYFSSDGHAGMGSSDLFVSRKLTDTTWQKALNLGSPINSSSFDGSVFVNAKGTIGYLASERAGSRGGLDIYSFDLYEGIKPIPTLCVKGYVSDKKTKERLKDQLISYYNWPFLSSLNKERSNKGDASFTHALHVGNQYLMEVVKPGFRPFYHILDLRKDTFPDNYYKQIRLRMPGLIDTLASVQLGVDSCTNNVDSVAVQTIEWIKQNWSSWSADSADVKFFINAYHYYGDSDSDTLANTYVSECLNRIKFIQDELKKADIPGNLFVLLIEPYIWREENEKYEKVYIDIVEVY